MPVGLPQDMLQALPLLQSFLPSLGAASMLSTGSESPMDYLGMATTLVGGYGAYRAWRWRLWRLQQMARLGAQALTVLTAVGVLAAFAFLKWPQ